MPNPGKCLNKVILPEHFMRNDVQIELTDGSKVKTCHIAADGRKFNWREVYDTTEDWNYIYIRQFSYTDENGETQIVDVEPRAPQPVLKRDVITLCGHVTKLNGKRWGVEIRVNWHTGVCQIIGDQGSPITGCLFQLLE